MPSRETVEGRLLRSCRFGLLLAGRGCSAKGRLVQVLADWCEAFPGFDLYCPSRRQPTPAFAALVEALRHRG